jgi:hypothetical protein
MHQQIVSKRSEKSLDNGIANRFGFNANATNEDLKMVYKTSHNNYLQH